MKAKLSRRDYKSASQVQITETPSNKQLRNHAENLMPKPFSNSPKFSRPKYSQVQNLKYWTMLQVGNKLVAKVFLVLRNLSIFPTPSKNQQEGGDNYEEVHRMCFKGRASMIRTQYSHSKIDWIDQIEIGESETWLNHKRDSHRRQQSSSQRMKI